MATRQKRADSERGYVTKATLSRARISPRKARLVLDLIKGKQVEPALNVLQHSPRKGAQMLSRLLQSAIASAKDRAGADVDKLWVTAGWVNMGKVMKRWLPRAHGRATPLKKRSAHITIVVGER